MITHLVLPAERRIHVASYARGALIAADALGRIPTPLNDVTAALELSTPEDLYALADAPPRLRQRLLRLKARVAGAFAVRERTIYLDMEQAPSKLRFTHGHELGHRALPWHDEAYYGDDDLTLRPDTTDELESEANAFSAELLFNLDEFTYRAHATPLAMAAALEHADVFGTSRHAGIRRYVENAPRSCALIIFGKHVVHPAGRPSLKLLRGIESARFRERYGPIDSCLPPALALGEWQIARDAHIALLGTAPTPILAGTLTIVDSLRGPTQMNYEVYSNTYLAFALLTPIRRLSIRPPTRAQWRSSS